MSYITVQFNESFSYPFHEDVLKKIPFLRDASETNKSEVSGDIIKKGAIPSVNLNVNVPFQAGFRHIAFIAKLVKSVTVLPMIDATSHADLLIVIQLSRYLGLTDELMATGLGGWTADPKWMQLHGTELLWTVHCELEECVDFGKFFRMHKNPAEVIAKIIAESKLHAADHVKMLMFFKNYDFTTCFDMNNNKVHAMIETLNKTRIRCGNTFLVNPHAIDRVYFDYNPSDAKPETMWKCDGISVIKRPELGENTIVDLETFEKRFSSFTHGMIEKSVNTMLAGEKFPHDGVIFAGGAITKLIAGEYNVKNARQSDCDIFIIGKTQDERSRNLNRVLEWFNSGTLKTTYYAIRGSVVTIYIKDIPRKYQIISIDKASAYEVLAHFDLTHIQWGYHCGKVIATPEACISMRSRVTSFNNVSRIRTDRLIKALHCGYDILKCERVLEEITDITDLISDPESPTLQKIIRDFYGWYYPMTIPDLDDHEYTQHVLSQIEKDAVASLVSTDIAYVANNITVGGNFEDGYCGHSFKNFNTMEIQCQAHGRRIQKAIVRSKFGVIRLTTALLTLSRVLVTDQGLTISAVCTDKEFHQFCKKLESNVYQMYKKATVTKNIFNGETITFNIPQYTIDNQLKKGFSILKNQRGKALNIEEDLIPGDTFQVLFSMEMIIQDEEREVHLIPSKFVKFQEHEAPTEITINDDNEEEPTDHDGEIEYVEVTI